MIKAFTICFLVFLACTASAAVSNEKLWNRYRSELLGFLAQGSQRDMKLTKIVAGPIDADWDVNKENLDVICNSRVKDGSTFELDTTASLEKTYNEFLFRGLQVNDQKKTNQMIEKALVKLEDDQWDVFMERSDEEYKCETKFNKYPRSNTFEQYARTSCPYYMELENAEEQITGQIQFYTPRIYGSYRDYQAVKARDDFIMAGNKGRTWKEANTLAQFVSNNRRGFKSPMSFKVSQTSSESSAKSKWKSMSIGIGIPGFFSVGYGSSKRSKSLTTNDKDLKIEFGAASYQAIRVRPNPSTRWLNTDFMNTWSKGPYRSGYSKSKFFGTNGGLSMIPHTLHVIYQPTITLTMNEKDSKEFESAKSSGLTLSIGVFSFGMNKGSTKTSVDKKDGLYVYTVTSKSETPQLIAVSYLPVGK